jgi:hypothetical protein
LRTIVGLRAPFAADLGCLRTGQAWLLQAEALLSQPGDQRTQEQAFASWLADVAHSSRHLPPPYARCRAHCVGVLTRMRPHLFAWVATSGLPRTNNDLERFIRAMKTRYRRMSGRKNWQSYLLRYGQRIAFYEVHDQMGDAATCERHLRRVAYAQWPHARGQHRPLEHRPLEHRPLEHRLRTQYRFLHRRAATLRTLEERWSHAPDST